MVVCDHCQTKNSLDSQFCKSCGREISEEARETARQENNRLISEGYTMLAEGRTDESELIARSVLEADESVLGAWSLLGMVYERKGEWIGALECYEKVLQKNPDSALDKIKVTQLKASLQKQMTPETRPNRGPAILAGIATVVVFGALGGALAIMTARPASANTLGQVAANDHNSPNVQPTANGKTSATQQGQNQVNDGIQPTDPNAVAPIRGNEADGGQEPGGTGAKSPRIPRFSGSGARSGDGSVTELPHVGGSGGTTDDNDPSGEVAPFKPDNIGITPRPDNVGQDPNEPTPEGGSSNSQGGSGTGTVKVQPNPNKGVIDIRPHSGDGNDGDSGNGVDAVMKSAREKHMIGQFDGAAKGYERARQMGKDDGSVNQRLGMVYEKMGKKSEAVAAYQRAIQKLENEARAGKPGAKEALDSAKQALKNLHGG